MKHAYLMIIAVAATLFATSEADACRRCGLFGNRCRFVSHAKFVEPVVVAQQPQTVILQANYASQPLGVLGATGYSFGGQYPTIGPYAYMDRQLAINQLARLSENLVKAASDAVPQFTAAITASANADANVAAIVAKGAAATAALQAAGTQQQAATREIRIQIGPAGEVKVLPDPSTSQPAAATPTPTPEPEVPQAIDPQAAVSDGLESCSKCHNASRAAGGFRLDGPLDANQILKAMAAVKRDQMPPKSETPDPTQRQQVQQAAIEELFSRVQ